MIVYTSRFCSIEFDAATATVKHNWTAATSEMTNEEFQVAERSLADVIKANKPRCIQTDALEFNFVISPDLQEWNAVTVLELFASLGGKKIGILIPPDIFAQVSIQQALDESESAFETRYFESRKDQTEWLNS